jgi:hypothetical protein
VGGFQLLIYFHNTSIGFKKIKGVVFQFKLIIKLKMASLVFIPQTIYKNPWVVLTELTNSYQSHWTSKHIYLSYENKYYHK